MKQILLKKISPDEETVEMDGEMYDWTQYSLVKFHPSTEKDWKYFTYRRCYTVDSGVISSSCKTISPLPQWVFFSGDGEITAETNRNQFQPSVAFHVEASHLFYSAK